MNAKATDWVPPDGWYRVKERSFLGEFCPGDKVEVRDGTVHNHGAGGSMDLDDSFRFCGVREGDWEPIDAPRD